MSCYYLYKKKWFSEESFVNLLKNGELSKLETELNINLFESTIPDNTQNNDKNNENDNNTPDRQSEENASASERQIELESNIASFEAEGRNAKNNLSEEDRIATAVKIEEESSTIIEEKEDEVSEAIAKDELYNKVLDYIENDKEAQEIINGRFSNGLAMAASAALAKNGVATENIDEEVENYFKWYLEREFPSKLPSKGKQIDEDLLPSGNINVMPISQKAKKPLENTIANAKEVLAGIVGKNEAGVKDEIKSIAFDAKNGKIIATDAQKMIAIEVDGIKNDEVYNPYTKETSKYKFPDYNAIIPTTNEIKTTFNVSDLASQARGLVRANKFLNKRYGINVKISIGGNSYYVNPQILLDVLDVFSKYGANEVEASFGRIDRAILFNSENIMGLVMPMLSTTARFKEVYNDGIVSENNISEQRTSQSSTRISPKQFPLVRKFIKRFAPNVWEMTDEEAIGEMEQSIFGGMPLGMMANGKYYFNSERATMETPMHEIGGHAFFAIMKSQYPGAYNEVMSKIGQVPKSVTDFVKENYPELEVGSERFNDEAIATYMGQIMAEPFEKAIKNDNSLLSTLKYWINYMYERAMNLLGIDNYMDINKFNSNTLGENLVHIGKGILTGRIRTDITTEELATLMSASPSYMKGAAQERKRLVKDIESLNLKLPAVEKEEKVIGKPQNKSLESSKKEGAVIPRDEHGVKVDQVMAVKLNPDGKSIGKVKEYLVKNTGLNIPSDDIISISYANGIANLMSEEEAVALSNAGIQILDTSTTDGYVRGRIFIFKTTGSNMSVSDALQKIAGIEISETNGYQKITKNGNQINSSSDLFGKVDEKAMLKVKKGDDLTLTVDFDNKWNRDIVEKIKDGQYSVKDISTLVIYAKDKKGRIVSILRATGGEFDTKFNEGTKSYNIREKINEIRRIAFEELKRRVDNQELTSPKVKNLDMQLESKTLSKAVRENIMEQRRKAIAEMEDASPIEIIGIKAAAIETITNESNATISSIAEFLENRKKANKGKQDFKAVFFKKNDNGEWAYFDQEGDEVKDEKLQPNDDEKHSTAYLISDKYQRRILFDKNYETEMTFEDFQALDLSTVYTRLSPENPYSDFRLKLDFEIETSSITASEDEVYGSPLEQAAMPKEERSEEMQGAEIVDDTKNVTQIQDENAKVMEEAISDEFIYNIVPSFFGMDGVNIDVDGNANYELQANIVDEMNDGLTSVGIRLTPSAFMLPRKYFKRILSNYVDYKQKRMSLKDFIISIVNNKHIMNNEILVEESSNQEDASIVSFAPRTANSKIVKIVGAENITRNALLHDFNKIYIQYKDTNFYYEFNKDSSPLSNQLAFFMKEVMAANNMDLTNIDAYYSSYLENINESASSPMVKLEKTDDNPYLQYKLVSHKKMADSITCL